MSSVWEDIGCRTKIGDNLKLHSQPNLSAIKNRIHSLGGKIISEKGSSLFIEIHKRRAFLWLQSDCYFIESKRLYGRNINKWLDHVEAYLIKMQLHSNL